MVTVLSSKRLSFGRLASAVAGLCLCTVGHAAFVVPTTATHGWDRPTDIPTATAARTTYQQWESFGSPVGPNAPDVGNLNPNATPNVYDTSGAAFITSGGNIYSPLAPLKMRADVSSYNLGLSAGTTVLFQVRTLGTELNYAGVVLLYSDATDQHTLSPVQQMELERLPLGGFGGEAVSTLFRFEIPYSPGAFRIEFPAAGSSMSADRVAIDTWTVVPEPAMAMSLAAGLLVHLGRRRRCDQAGGQG